MKTLFLLRHAKSDWNDPNCADRDRPLAPRGVKAAHRINHWLRDHCAADFRRHNPLILCSTARRARDTARLALADLDLDLVINYDRSLYLAGAQALIDRLRHVPDTVTTVMIIGHNPDLADLVDRLRGDGTPDAVTAHAGAFPTAALAILELPIESWANSGDQDGFLRAFILPRREDHADNSAAS
ncbi:MAG: histidine phosphatase family protein [Azospirillaceae bacterium]|nr:histidine phosphatase family protein [Azospirillaceae bacterium]